MVKKKKNGKYKLKRYSIPFTFTFEFVLKTKIFTNENLEKFDVILKKKSEK